ncbi:MAG: cobyrinic acid a,c-diamide synthase [Rhodospirillaceae bacterium]|nr:cobyrinic acid a,c-diamide synthase [Rhodospirillaceae bacterium]
MSGSELAPGLVIAAPSSGSGKTTITLGLLRACRDIGMTVGSAKCGPDYIDPKFHEAASGSACINLDGWAMRPAVLDQLAAVAAGAVDLLVIEGVMGLFDGAPQPGATDTGSTAELAARVGWPVVLVVDTRAQAQSVAALVRGFRDHHEGISLVGVILNRVAGDRHVRTLTLALGEIDVVVLGSVPRFDRLDIPERYLGLVQAVEHSDLEGFIAAAGRTIRAHVDLDSLRAFARPSTRRLKGNGTWGFSPPGQRVAVAHDPAFSFSYSHVLEAWRCAGVEVLHFAPLLDQGPDSNADAVYLPGGYPELHAGRLAGCQRFLDGLRGAAEAGKPVLGECGGYMVLGDRLVDKGGVVHRMAGLLSLESSFVERRLSLGYRSARTYADTALGPAGSGFRGHEFHYATVMREGGDEPLFMIRDAEGTELGEAGLRRGSVLGSFLHLIDQSEP